MEINYKMTKQVTEVEVYENIQEWSVCYPTVISMHKIEQKQIFQQMR